MGTVVDSLFTVLMSWVRALVNGLWALFSQENTMLAFLGKNWMMIAAALIAAGNADAGLGIYSAAKMYGLDFIPVCNETYEFLIDKEYLDNPMVQAFLEVLYSDEFKSRLNEMGGYTEG